MWPVPPCLSGGPETPAPTSPSCILLSFSAQPVAGVCGSPAGAPPPPPHQLCLEAPRASTQEALGKCSRVTLGAWLGVLSLPCSIWAARPHPCRQGAQTHPPQKAPRRGAHSCLARRADGDGRLSAAPLIRSLPRALAAQTQGRCVGSELLGGSDPAGGAGMPLGAGDAPSLRLLTWPPRRPQQACS